MIKNGKGGGNTRTGLVFEGLVDLSTFLNEQPHYKVRLLILLFLFFCQTTDMTDNQHHIIIVKFSEFINRTLKQCRVFNRIIKELARRNSKVIAYLKELCHRRQGLAGGYVVNITSAMTEIITHLIF